MQIIDLGCNIKLFKSNENKKYKVLLASSFHGDENCFDILTNIIGKKFENMAISVIPIVNIYGYNMKIRENENGQNINCSFNHPKCRKAFEFTKQADSIISNLDIIKQCAKDGYASLHEDKNSIDNYCHLWIKGDPSKKILKELNVKDYNLCYNTLEDFLWHEGIPLTACLEFTKNNRMNFMLNFLRFIGENK